MVYWKETYYLISRYPETAITIAAWSLTIEGHVTIFALSYHISIGNAKSSNLGVNPALFHIKASRVL
jgi:hypothetical protein